MIVHVIPDEGERVGRNEISESSSELTYHKKDVDADMSSYNRVKNALKELYTSYIPTRQKMHEPVIKGNCKVTRGTRVIPIMEHEYGKILWACSTSIYTYTGEPDTPKEVMTGPNGHLWKMSAISEVEFLFQERLGF